jgi:hypothetical protein
VDKSPAYARLAAVATAGDLPTAPTPPHGTRPARASVNALRTPSQVRLNSLRGRYRRIGRPKHRNFSGRGKVPILACCGDDTEADCFRVRFARPNVRFEPSFDKRVAPSCPIFPAPRAFDNPGRTNKGLIAWCLPACLGRQSLNFADDKVAHNATVARHTPCHYRGPARRLRRGMLSTAQHRESATISEQQGVGGGGPDKRPHIAARGGRLF